MSQSTIKPTLTIYTALWTHDDVAFGANDPSKTTSEELTFDDLDDLVQYLLCNELTEPSSYPVLYNETRVWYSQASRLLQPGEEELDRYEKTAHRGISVTDQQWISVVHAIDAKF